MLRQAQHDKSVECQVISDPSLIMKKPKLAIYPLILSLKLTPSAEAYNALGDAYLQLGQKTKAKAAFQKASNHAKRYVEPIHRLPL